MPGIDLEGGVTVGSDTGPQKPQLRAQAWLPWAGFLLLSTPVLADWARHVASRSWASYSLIFPVLVVLSVRSRSPKAPQLGAAFALVLPGIAIQLWALASGAVRNGRIGVLLCALAVLLLQGRVFPRTMVLLALCVPLPSLVIRRIGEPLARMLAETLAAVIQVSGTPSVAEGTQLLLPTGAIYLDGTDVGISAAILAFGLSWFACDRREIPMPRALKRSALAGIAGAILHVVITLCWFLLADEPAGDDQRTSRDRFVFMAIAGIVLAAARLEARAPGRAESR